MRRGASARPNRDGCESRVKADLWSRGPRGLDFILHVSNSRANTRSRSCDAERPTEPCPSRSGGRREDRASDAPAALRVRIENTQVSHHRFTGSIRPSLRNGFNGLLRALPGEPGFLATIPGVKRQLHRRVNASVGASGPHDFAVREVCAFVLCAIRVHRIPHSTFVTIAIRPS
jgi:hypothetical protein